MESIQNPHLQVHEDGLLRVRFNSPERVGELSWPSVVAIETPSLEYHARHVEIVLAARDQGWGNTGHSYVQVDICGPDEDIHSERLLTLNHRLSSLEGICLSDSMVKHAVSGSIIRVVLVSAAYPGYEAVAEERSIHVWYSARIEMILIEKTLQRYTKRTLHEMFNPRSSEDDLELCKNLAFLFADCDKIVFSKIIMFWLR